MTTQHNTAAESFYKGGNLLSKTTSSSASFSQSTQVEGASVSGTTVLVQAGRDAAIKGSTIVADNAVSVRAERDLTVTTAEQTSSTSSSASKTKSGLFAAGAGVTIGKQQQSQGTQTTSTEQVGSQIGSLNGSVSLRAGDRYTQTGSQVFAPQGDVDIAAKKVLIDAATNTSMNQSEQHFKQSGLSVSVSNPLLNAAQSTAQMASAADKTSDPRMQALAAAAAALSIKDAVNQVAANPSAAGGIDINVSLGSSRSDSAQAQTSISAVGSRTAASGNVTIQATGDSAHSTLNIAGSDIQAGGTATLKSEGSMTLEAAQNTSEQRSRNSSSSGSIGTSFGSSGWTVNASASKGQGKADGTDLTYTNTHVSGAKVELQSGGDTALKGAVVAGQQVTADIKGNLTIESLQDTSTYAAKQTSAGIGVAVPIGAGNASVSVNASKANVDGDHASVTEQAASRPGMAASSSESAATPT